MGRFVVGLLLSGLESCETAEPGVEDTAGLWALLCP